MSEPNEKLAGYGLAPNAVPVAPDSDGWYKIAPYGEWPTVDQKYLQVFGRPEAERMARTFNSMPFKLSRWLLSNEVPVYIGHPDIDRKVWTDERNLAPKHLKLEAREDGLWGQAAWNALGRENIAESYWRYPSPVWLFPKPKPGTNRVFPDILQSVGLSNFVNTPDAERVTANASPETGKPELNNEDPTQIMDPEIIGALKLEEGATKEDALEAITTLRAKAEGADTALAENETAMNAVITERDQLKADLAAEVANRETAENAVRVMQETSRDQLITAAVESGALSKADADAKWVPLFAKDYDTAANAIATLKPGTVLNTQSVDVGNRKPDVLNVRERQLAVNAAVEEAMPKFGNDYDRAFNAVRKDPANAHLFEAMKAKAESAEEEKV